MLGRPPGRLALRVDLIWADRAGRLLRRDDAAVTALRQRLGGRRPPVRWVHPALVARMDFRILGPLEALAGGRDLAPTGSKQRALLALLLLHANETLTSTGWSTNSGESIHRDRPKDAQAHISRLREALDAGADNGGGR